MGRICLIELTNFAQLFCPTSLSTPTLNTQLPSLKSIAHCERPKQVLQHGRLPSSAADRRHRPLPPHSIIEPQPEAIKQTRKETANDALSRFSSSSSNYPAQWTDGAQVLEILYCPFRNSCTTNTLTLLFQGPRRTRAARKRSQSVRGDLSSYTSVLSPGYLNH